jgi:hypothetical protein
VSPPSSDECSAFGPSASDDAFDVGFPVPHQRTLVSQHEGTRATRLHIARRSVSCTNKVVRARQQLVHLPSSPPLTRTTSERCYRDVWTDTFGESFVVESRRVHSAMCGGSMRFPYSLQSTFDTQGMSH